MVATVKWSEFPAGSSISGANISVGLQSGDNVQWTMSQLATFFWTSPTLVTPTLGVATATSVSAPALLVTGSSSGTVTIQGAAAAGTWSFTLPTSGGTSGYILTTNGSGVTTWTNPTALGVDLDIGTTAITGGTTTRVLYDNAGVLGEYTITGTGTTVVMQTAPTITGLATINGGTNTGVIASTGYSLTGSNATSMIDLAGTWNTSGTPTALKLNITDTASNAASLLMDLQVGGTSRFNIDKHGKITDVAIPTATGGLAGGKGTKHVFQDNAADGSIAFKIGNSDIASFAAEFGKSGPSGPSYGAISARSVFLYGNDSAGFTFMSENAVGPIIFCAGANTEIGRWVAGGGLSIGASGSAAILQADAANTLAQRNSTTAQHFRVYNTYTDGSNYEYGRLSWTTNVLTIGAVAAGSGTLRATTLHGASVNLAFGATPTTAWTVNSSGHFLAGTDNTYDIGANGATRPRTIYVGTGITLGSTGTWTGSGLQVAAAGFLLFAARAGFTSSADGIIQLRNNGNTDFDRLQFGGTTSSFPALKRSSAGLQSRLADDSAYTTHDASAYLLSGGPGIYSGSGSPEGAVTAATGSLYLNTAGGTDTTLYSKNSGSGNTGWVAIDNV